jgi:hypothetical protein
MGVLMIPRITTGTQNSVLYDSSKEVKGGIPVPFVYADQFVGPVYPQYNVTINPLGRPSHTDYVVNILLDSKQWNKTSPGNIPLDLWVVNHTGKNIINSYLENSTYPVQLNRSGNFLFPGLKVYAESIDQSAVVGPLHGLDHNGIYTIMIINPYQGADFEANVTIVLEDTLTTYRYILEPSEITILSASAIALIGLGMILKKPKKRMATRVH